MKESISVTAIFQIVILFILLFAGIMALTINNSNAFAVKDDIISIIELSKGEFLDENKNLNEDMVNAMKEASYRTTGKCEEEWVGYTKEGAEVSNDKKAAICIKTVDVGSGINEELRAKYPNAVASEDILSGKYYMVRVFYQLDIPIINQIFNMSTAGSTKIIYKK